MLLVGAGKAQIKFSEELFPIEGFSKIYNYPHVRVLCLEKKTRVAIVAVELVMMPDELINECKKIVAEKLNMNKENVWVHINHVITTPHAPRGPLLGHGGNIVAEEKTIEKSSYNLYESVFLRAVEKAAIQTSQTMQKAYIGITTAIVDINVNRDVKTDAGWWITNPGDGVSNKEMTVIGFRNEQGNLVSGLYSYGIKPCAGDNAGMRSQQRIISTDLTGIASERMEDELKAPILFLMSAAADQVPQKQAWYDVVMEDGAIQTIDLGAEYGIECAKEQGEKLASCGVKAFSTLNYEKSVGNITATWDSFRSCTKSFMELKPRTKVAWEAQQEIEVPIGMIAIGEEVLFVACKPEINCITEIQLKQESKYPYTLLVTMVNGGMKYMPDKDAYSNCTWEAQNSMFMPGAAEKFIDKVMEMI